MSSYWVPHLRCHCIYQRLNPNGIIRLSCERYHNSVGDRAKWFVGHIPHEQNSNQISDFAALFISIHSSLQILRLSNTQHSCGGLAQHKRFVYVTVVVTPSLLTGLAYSNPEGPFRLQGPFCTLPIRPVWYRMALA